MDRFEWANGLTSRGGLIGHPKYCRLPNEHKEIIKYIYVGHPN